MSSDSDDTDNENETGDLRSPGTAAPAIIDADESIVLSDLVRTGEASRLRRRGAMRLDHGSAGPLPLVTVRPASWDEEAEGLPEDDVEEGETIGSPVFSRTERDRSIRYSRLQQREREARRRNGMASTHQQHHNDDEYKYTLICGGVDEDADTWGDGATEPWTPSILPLFPPTQRRQSVRKSPRRTNGCGALIHMHASPRQRMSVWTAKTQASAAVISMDPSYFDRTAVAKIVRSACGCVREGVGCAVCGNPLGTRYKPCRTAGDGLFSSSSHSSSSRSKQPSAPLRPEGSRYWHAQLHPSSGNDHDNDFYVYTFFSAAVTSHPHFTFPFHPTSATATTQRTAQARPESRSRLRAQRVTSRPVPPPQPPMSPLSPVYTFDSNPTPSANPDTNPETPETYTSVTPPIFSDRLVTASPTPLSDPEIVTINRSGNNSSALPGGDYDGDRAMAFGYLRQPGVEFDPDGEFFFGPASEGTYAYGPGLGQGLYGGDGDGDDENKAVDVRMLFPER
ncbi:hypothetical protein BD779DRAFT_1477000 [Infundibulicybe gibba]|nr:hypothetical protein BD779DRAFT_1477000 [Infundibulicybe gibba]